MHAALIKESMDAILINVLDKNSVVVANSYAWLSYWKDIMNPLFQPAGNILNHDYISTCILKLNIFLVATQCMQIANILFSNLGCKWQELNSQMKWSVSVKCN